MRSRACPPGAALLLLFVGCGGGGGPSSPTPEAPTPTPGIPAGTVLAVVSGETDQSVAGASLGVGGRTLTSDGAGQVPLPEAVNFGATLDVSAAGFLDRQTLLRAASSTRFTLWPATSSTGLDQNYTATLVYTEDGGALGGEPLYRLRPSTEAVALPSPGIANDPEALGALQQAIGSISEATGGQVVYRLVNDRPASGIVFEVRADPGDNDCDASTRAFTSIRIAGNEITGGQIVFCSETISRTATASHELGHTFGLGHSPDPRELMFGSFSRARNTVYSSREALCMRLMLQRRGGNRFPDNDRQATTSGEQTRRVICH